MLIRTNSSGKAVAFGIWTDGATYLVDESGNRYAKVRMRDPGIAEPGIPERIELVFEDVPARVNRVTLSVRARNLETVGRATERDIALPR